MPDRGATADGCVVPYRRRHQHTVPYRIVHVHPGARLLRDFIEPMGISRYRVAKNTNVPQRRIDLIFRGGAAVL